VPELPVSVRLALWVTASWAADDDVERAWARALPDIDAVAGDVHVLRDWRSLGESGLLVALPRSGDQTGLPACPESSRAAAVTAAEAVVSPSIGGLLVPSLSTFGPEGAAAPDRGWRVDWQAHPADPVPVHRVTGLDLSHARRAFGEALVEGTELLHAVGGPAWPARPGPPGPSGAARWALPDGIPAPVAELLTRAATVERACSDGLAYAADGLSADVTRARETALRELRDVADRTLVLATNVAVAVLAGWRPR
jgi:hypothetical protein